MSHITAEEIMRENQILREQLGVKNQQLIALENYLNIPDTVESSAVIDTIVEIERLKNTLKVAREKNFELIGNIRELEFLIKSVSIVLSEPDVIEEPKLKNIGWKSRFHKLIFGNDK